MIFLQPYRIWCEYCSRFLLSLPSQTTINEDVFNNLVGRAIWVPLNTLCGRACSTCIHVATVLLRAEWQWCIPLLLPPLQPQSACGSSQESEALKRRVRRSAQTNTPAGVDGAWEPEWESIQQPSEGSDATSIPACLSEGWDGWMGGGAAGPLPAWPVL